MKTTITALLLIVSTLIYAQDKSEIVQDSIMTSSDIAELKSTLEALSETLENEVIFRKSYVKNVGLNSNVKKTYTLTINGSTDEQAFKELKEFDFEALEATLDTLSMALTESPKLRDLAQALKKLQEKH